MKVLVIDDKQENLDAAREFFSKIPVFEFLFAMNRKEAEELLKVSDAVITDGSFPYETEENFNNSHGLNGHYVLLLASSQNKPAILLSDHGEQFYSNIANNQEVSKRTIEKQFTNFDPFDMVRYSEYWNIVQNPEVIVELPTRSYTTKKDSSGWEYGWKEIQKQF